MSDGEVHADGAQLVPVQSGSGGRAAAGHLRPGGREPLPGGRVAVRPRGVQVDPVHPAHLGGSLRVHPHCALRGPVGSTYASGHVFRNKYLNTYLLVCLDEPLLFKTMHQRGGWKTS